MPNANRLLSLGFDVLFVEAYKLFASLDIPGYEPAIGVGLLLVYWTFLDSDFHISDCFFDGLPMASDHVSWCRLGISFSSASPRGT